MKNDNINNDFAENNSTQEEVGIKDIFMLCFQHRIWFMLSLFIMVTLGVFYAKTKPNIYSRTATVIVEDERRGGSTSEAAVFQEIFSMGGSSVYNEIGLFESNRLMYDVVERLNLETEYHTSDRFRKVDLYKSSPIQVSFMGNIAKDQAVSFTANLLSSNQASISELTFYNIGSLGNHVEMDEMVVNLNDSIATPYGSFSIQPTVFMTENNIGKYIEVRHMSVKSAARRYINALKVSLVDKYASLVTISISDESIQRAEDVINTLIAVYRDDAINDKNTILSNTSNFIDERLALIEAELTAVDAEIESFKSTNKLTDVASESSRYLESVTRIDQEQFNVLNRLSMAQYMKEYLDDEANADALIPINIGLNSEGLHTQIALYNENLTKRDKLLINSSENNPLVADLQKTLVSMRSSIVFAVDNLIANLEMNARNYRKKENENLNKIKNIPSQQKYIISIQRQQTIKEQLYLYLLNKKEESELQRSITESNCRIVDYAEGTSIPVAPNKKLIVLFCMILGLVIPACVLYIISLFNTSVKSKKDIRSVVSIPYLGDIPTEKIIPENHLVVDDTSRTPVGEAFRIIRDNLDFMNIDRSSKGGIVMQFTSLNPNSGKTFVTANIAMSMALSGSKVVVVDLDIRKGTMSKISSVGTKQTGVSQYLGGKVLSHTDIIKPFAKDVPFDIIASGILPPNPAELLKSDRLNKLIDELRATYDYILIDNPPYGVVVDTAICARVCDQSIYVIRAGSFDKRLLPDIQELYDYKKLPNMSLLLNGINITTESDYGYGYGYGYNYGKEKKKPLIKRLLGI